MIEFGLMPRGLFHLGKLRGIPAHPRDVELGLLNAPEETCLILSERGGPTKDLPSHLSPQDFLQGFVGFLSFGSFSRKVEHHPFATL